MMQQVLETFWSLGMKILIQEFISESEGRDVRPWSWDSGSSPR